jgi:hypothetical protein
MPAATPAMRYLYRHAGQVKQASMDFVQDFSLQSGFLKMNRSTRRANGVSGSDSCINL